MMLKRLVRKVNSMLYIDEVKAVKRLVEVLLGMKDEEIIGLYDGRKAMAGV